MTGGVNGAMGSDFGITRRTNGRTAVMGVARHIVVELGGASGAGVCATRTGAIEGGDGCETAVGWDEASDEAKVGGGGCVVLGSSGRTFDSDVSGSSTGSLDGAGAEIEEDEDEDEDENDDGGA